MLTGMQTLHASLICAVTMCHGGGGTDAAHPAAAGEMERGGEEVGGRRPSDGM